MVTHCSKRFIEETLIKSQSGMKCEVHGAHNAMTYQMDRRHSSTEQQGNSPAQAFIQRFLKCL